MGIPPLEKVTSSPARSRARRAARSALSRIRMNFSSPRQQPARIRDRYPTTPVRMLLNSWAMPPASIPTASRRWDFSSSSSIRLREVMSRMMAMMAGWPSNEVTPELNSTSIRRPSRCQTAVSWMVCRRSPSMRRR